MTWNNTNTQHNRTQAILMWQNPSHRNQIVKGLLGCCCRAHRNQIMKGLLGCCCHVCWSDELDEHPQQVPAQTLKEGSGIGVYVQNLIPTQLQDVARLQRRLPQRQHVGVCQTLVAQHSSNCDAKVSFNNNTVADYIATVYTVTNHTQWQTTLWGTMLRQSIQWQTIPVRDYVVTVNTVTD